MAAPTWPLVAAVAANILSVALLIRGDVVLPPLSRHGVGWAASSLLGFALVVLHRREEERLRYEEPKFVSRPAQHRLATVLLLLGIGMCALHSWWFATELAS